MAELRGIFYRSKASTKFGPVRVEQVAVEDERRFRTELRELEGQHKLSPIRSLLHEHFMLFASNLDTVFCVPAYWRSYMEPLSEAGATAGTSRNRSILDPTFDMPITLEPTLMELIPAANLHNDSESSKVFFRPALLNPSKQKRVHEGVDALRGSDVCIQEYVPLAGVATSGEPSGSGLQIQQATKSTYVMHVQGLEPFICSRGS